MHLAEVQVHAHVDRHLGQQARRLLHGPPQVAPEEAARLRASSPVVAEQASQDQEAAHLRRLGAIGHVLEARQVAQQVGRERLRLVQPPVQLLLAALQLLARHVPRVKVRAPGRADVVRQAAFLHVRAVQPALGLEPDVQRRLRHGQQHAQHDDGDLRLLEELVLLVEDAFVVVVEADDHPGRDEQVVRLDLVDRLQEVEALVLGLARLGQAFLAGRFDADEDGDEVGIAEQAEQFVVAGHVDAGLGVEGQRPALPGVPGGQGAQQLLGVGAMADEVVIGEEDLEHAAAVPGIHLAQHLLDRLEAHLSAVHDDDVAELAGERAAAGTLDDAVGVPAFQHAQPRRGRVGQVDLLVLDVVRGMASPGEVAEEARPGVLGLALEEDVTVLAALLRQEVGHRPADHHRFAAGPEAVGNLEGALDLDDVAGDAHDLGVRVEVHLLAGVLVAHLDAVVGRRQGRQREQPQRREDRVEGGQGHEVLQPPVRGRECRLYQVDAWSPCSLRSEHDGPFGQWAASPAG